MSTLTSVVTAPFGRRIRREYPYLVITAVLAVPAFALVLVGVLAAALSVIGVGLPVLVVVLIAARFLPRWFRAPARALLQWDWADPAGTGRRQPNRIRVILTDDGRWRALAYAGAKFPISIAGAYLGTLGVFLGVAGLTFPLWWTIHPYWFASNDEVTWSGSWVLCLQGALLLLVMPWFIRLIVAVDRWLAHALLTPNADRERVKVLESRRTALVGDAEATLRRLERDLHDGTQARLVGLGMLLGRLHASTAAAGLPVLDEARDTVTETLAELRRIITSVHPPALDDGLSPALATLVARSSLPVSLHDDLTRQPDDATATALYFAANELLTNVAKHAHADSARVVLSDTPRTVTVTVLDDGHGGATADGGGTGLDGLRRRAEAFDGRLEIDSPPGGPTVAAVTLPVG